MDIRYRLGIDVGTASCALVAWSLDGDGQPSELVYDSLDLWSEPLLPAKSGGVGELKKAARRRARMLRRSHCRRARRLRRIAYLAALLGLDRTAVGPDGGQGIHRIRARAAEDRINLEDLLRVFLHMAKRRGPSGAWVEDALARPPRTPRRRGRTADGGDGAEAEENTEGGPDKAEKDAEKEKRTIAAGVRELERLVREAAAELGKESLTLGQYLEYRRTKGQGVILGRKDAASPPLYPSRRMVEEEFDRIWEAQARFHPVMQKAGVREQFREAIFRQRPLKSPAPMVGRCPLEPTLPRAPAAQPAAQEFRIEKEIADLRWGTGRGGQPLTPEQKEVVRGLLHAAGEVPFERLREALESAGCPGPAGRGLNTERRSRSSLKGNTTFAAIRALGLEDEWRKLGERTRIQVINFLADLGSPEALDEPDWDRKFVTGRIDPGTGKPKMRVFSQEMVGFVNRLRVHPRFGRLSAMGFDAGRSAYSIKALGKLVRLMREEGLDEHAAIACAYPEAQRPVSVRRELPLPAPTGNTVVDVALRQVYRAVRRAIEDLGGPPAQVIVELSRDMALGLRKRNEIETRIERDTRARREAAQAIQDNDGNPTRRNIDRYLLWVQQDHGCVYCDGTISLAEALGAETEKDHILPRTLTRVGGKRSQLVLVHRGCNQEKGNRTPWEAFGTDESRWRIIEKRAEMLEKNKQAGKARLLRLKDWEGEVLDDEAIRGFADRQLHEGSWIAKLTAQWLRSVCPDVAVTRGELTAHLRRIWKLETVIPEVRYEAGLPVLDREGERVSEEEFRRHRSWWEGHGPEAGGVLTERALDKRIDHRHHLIDALVVSLSSRSLYVRMAENYKQERERERPVERRRLGLFVEPPVRDLRDLALRLVRDARIRHKPDRYPNGPLFDETAYGLERRPGDRETRRLVSRKSLAGLVDKDEEKTRKVLETIESETTRRVVLDAFEERRRKGVDLKRIFDEPILHPQYATPIRYVRVLGNSEATAHRVTHTNRDGILLEKRYSHKGYAYLEIRVDDQKMVGAPRLVRPLEAIAEKSKPTAYDVKRFWKNDTVLYDGAYYVVGQIKAVKSGGKLCLVPVTETCTFDKLKERGIRQKSVSGEGLARVTVVDVREPHSRD